MTLNQFVTDMGPMAVDTVQIQYGIDMELVQDITPKVPSADMVRVYKLLTSLVSFTDI